MLTNFKVDSEEHDELLDILSRYQCRSNPTEKNLKNLLVEIAHLQLIQSPKYISSAFAEIFSAKPIYVNPEEVQKIYLEKTPTRRKVLKILSFPKIMNAKSNDVSQFLIDFIKSMNLENY